MRETLTSGSTENIASGSRGGLYVHIPYCASKCLYCDFYSGKFKKHDYAGLAQALLNECEERRDELPALLDTLYIGGGTPSMMPAEDLERLLAGLRNIAGHKRWESLKEATIEVNPDDVTPQMCRAWASAGITRISMGVQSFNDSLLRFMGRRHNGEVAERAFHTLRKYFNNISIDLMFGIPGQTSEDWEQTLRKAVSLRPDHISCYALMYETGTRISLMRDAGLITELSEEMTEDMYSELRDTLRKEGYEAYEISNFALPGRRSLHNSSYWKGAPYLGLGPSAHSYDGVSRRRWNKANIKYYLERFTPHNRSACQPFYSEERLNAAELRDEMILTRLRTAEGIDLREYSEKFGEKAMMRLRANAANQIARGLAEITGSHLKLTRAGIMISDSVMVSLSM